MSSHVRFALLASFTAAMLLFGGALPRPAPADCSQGCFVVDRGCVSNSTFRVFSIQVASNIFWDPDSRPDQVPDQNQNCNKHEYQNCTSCTCTWNECDYPCQGSFIDGQFVWFGQVNFATACVDI